MISSHLNSEKLRDCSMTNFDLVIKNGLIFDLRWLESCRERGIRVYGQGLTTDAGFAFTFEDWNFWDDKPAWREATIRTVAERRAKLADPGRRPDLRNQVPRTVTGPISDIVVTAPQAEKNQKYLDHTVGQIAEVERKHPVDVMLDIAVSDNLETEFFAAPPNVSEVHLQEIVDDPWIFSASPTVGHTPSF